MLSVAPAVSTSLATCGGAVGPPTYFPFLSSTPTNGARPSRTTELAEAPQMPCDGIPAVPVERKPPVPGGEPEETDSNPQNER